MIGFRTGLTKVGLLCADLGMRSEDPTIAELLKPLGFATGQFGEMLNKNTIASVEFAAPIVYDDDLYDWLVEFRIGFLF